MALQTTIWFQGVHSDRCIPIHLPGVRTSNSWSTAAAMGNSGTSLIATLALYLRRFPIQSLPHDRRARDARPASFSHRG